MFAQFFDATAFTTLQKFILDQTEFRASHVEKQHR